MDTLITPQLTRRMFIASTVMMIVAVALSAFNAAVVISAPRYTTVGVPQTVGFEGFLAQANGQPIANGPYQLTFRVYDVATGGAALWDQDITNVQVTNGLYSVALGGSADPFTSTTFDSDRWVGVTVDGGSEITPRTRVSSVPFALNADNANRIGGGGTANMVVAFDGPCPSGWTEYTQAQGRTIVGVPVNGEVGGIVPGSVPLGDKEDRTHTHTGPLHQHITPIGADDYYDTGANSFAYANLFGYATTYQGIDTRVVGTGGQYSGGIYRVLLLTSADGNGPTSSASTSQVIPYIQLRYCKLNP